MLRRSAAQERMEKTLKEIRNSNETPEQRKERWAREYQRDSEHCVSCGKYMLFGLANPLCRQCQKLERDNEIAHRDKDISTEK
jgi:hypothetical protein